MHEIIITARAALYGGRKHDPLRDYFIREMMEKRGIKGLPALLLAAAQKLHVAPRGFPEGQPAYL